MNSTEITDSFRMRYAPGRRTLAVAALLLSLSCTGCSDETTSTSDQPSSNAVAATPIFDELSGDTGLRFEHSSGATGAHYMPEIMGSGIGLLDFDGDDDLDVFVVQGGSVDPDPSGASAATDETHHQLFRNELNPTGELRFVNVSASAGIENAGFGMGVAIGDIDNDGDPDLYVTHFGKNVLYVNDGAGQFENVSVDSGTNDDGFGSSAAILDYDSDGLLDIFSVNYNNFTASNNRICRNAGRSQDYCGPLVYSATTDRLYRNLGDGTFGDVSLQTGISSLDGTGLGVTAADFNGDGAVDIYVANDGMANRFWLNDGAGVFEDAALMSGNAYNADGASEASMGILAGDVDGDGDEDLFLTHLTAETNTLYLNDGLGNFRDATDQLNLGGSSRAYTGFGTVWIDYDNDGDQDILIANGAVRREHENLNDRNVAYGQRNQLYRNIGAGRFEHASDIAGEAFAETRVGRGAAVGDIDNDGDLDAVISNADGPVELLINRGEQEHHGLRVRLQGQQSNRDGIGARVAVIRSDGNTLWRRAHTDGSYLSASDVRVHFGLGADPQISAVGVIWPTGKREIWSDVAIDSQLLLVEGSGDPWGD